MQPALARPFSSYDRRGRPRETVELTTHGRGCAVKCRALGRRALQQYTRKTRVHTGSSIILVVGGMVVGLLRSYSNDLKDTPSTMCLVCTVMGVLSSASSLSYFGNEKLVHLQVRANRVFAQSGMLPLPHSAFAQSPRFSPVSVLAGNSLRERRVPQESRGGVNVLAYFLSKNAVIAFDNLLHPLLFYASYTQFVYSNLSFVIFYMHLVAVGFATNGIGMTLSMFLGSDTALLGSALLPLVSGVFLAGIDPRVLVLKNKQLEFLSNFSFARCVPLGRLLLGFEAPVGECAAAAKLDGGPRATYARALTPTQLASRECARWATEALTVYELSIEDEADQMRVRMIYKRFGFREDRYFLCISMLLLIGVMWRLLALALLMSQVRALYSFFRGRASSLRSVWVLWGGEGKEL